MSEPQQSRPEVAFEQHERLEIDGKSIWLPPPARIPTKTLIARPDLALKALAAWLELGDKKPLSFRLYGPPGTGKNALVYTLARERKQRLYIISGHDELGPEDVACTPVMTTGHAIAYVASPLLAAMLKDGICFFDEMAKAPMSALDPLASVLDDRRSLTSVVAGLTVHAAPGFRFCAALNQDEEDAGILPEFIDDRTRPAIEVAMPGPSELERILKAHLDGALPIWISAFLKEFPAPISARRALTVLEYASRLHHLQHGSRPSAKSVVEYLRRAHLETVGDDATAESA